MSIARSDSVHPLQLLFPAVTVCNKNRINCRELNKYKALKKCSSDEYDPTCNKTAADECDEICSLTKVACEEDATAILTPCDVSSGDIGEGSGSGIYACMLYNELTNFDRIRNIGN